jgi:hypothetical protein
MTALPTTLINAAALPTTFALVQPTEGQLRLEPLDGVTEKK